MEELSYEEAWSEYRQALERLYDQSVYMMTEGYGDVITEPEVFLADYAEEVIRTSRRLGNVIARYLEDEPEQRELAELKLVSVASTDAAVANDLARKAQDALIETADRAPELPFAVAQVLQVLEIPPEDGARALMGRRLEIEEIGEPPDLKAAKQRLREAASGAIGSIQGDAARVCGLASSGLALVPVGEIQEVARWALGDLMDRLGEGAGLLLRRAARLLASAVEKILKMLPEGVQDAVRDRVLGWLSDLVQEDGGLWEKLLVRVYRADDVREEVDQRVDGVPDTLNPAILEAAAVQMGQLADKFGGQRRVISLAVRGMRLANGWIVTLPHGAVALAAAYVVAIGYAVFAGGDYLDWSRPGAQYLDFVPGVRSVVQQATTTA